MNRPSSQTFRPSVRHRRSGVILLVVLSSLTFFSLLVISYFVFASQARNTAHTTNVSKTREADINGLMEEAMLTLLRDCLLYTSPSPRDQRGSRMPSSA